MKKWMVTLAAVVAVVALAAPAANATHGSAIFVDQIDGSGAGTYFGTLEDGGCADTADWYTFFGIAGFPVTIAMNAIPDAEGGWTPALTLYRTPAPAAAGDDRYASYTFIALDDFDNPASLQVVLPATGFYVVAAESVGGCDPADFGPYVLTIGGFAFPIGGQGSFRCPPAPIMSPCRLGFGGF
jgi:hypothetical protein